jgi:hypothetical protein
MTYSPCLHNFVIQSYTYGILKAICKSRTGVCLGKLPMYSVPSSVSFYNPLGMDYIENTDINVKEASLLCRCLAIDVLLFRPFAFTRMCSVSRCLVMSIHVTTLWNMKVRCRADKSTLLIPPDNSSSHSHILLHKEPFKYYTHLCLRVRSGIFLSVVLTKILNNFYSLSYVLHVSISFISSFVIPCS